MLLAIDTATRLLGIALHDKQRLLAEHAWYTGNQHSVELSPAIQRMFDQSNIAINDLSAIAVSQGPGSFTGLRIGISVAKGLAMALRLPLVGVPTLDIVATGTPHFKGQLVTVVTAGRGRIIAGNYRWRHRNWQHAGEPEITDWDTLLAGIEKTTLINGEIDMRGHNLIQQSDKPVYTLPAARQMRRPGFLAQIALEKIASSDFDDAALLVPIYLKQPGVDA
jgi:tRNA threonylcarbamoyladenosine biosynthesis protein TsaB